MCAIAGSSSYKEVKNILKATSHRGPDSSNIVESGKFFIGANRLSIVDVDNGHNPHTWKGYSAVLNGEIYNHKELRKELESKGFTFETSSDTEVVLKGYYYLGERIFERLDGMFAIAIATPNNKLVLARDPIGQKPLYYRVKPSSFAFSSTAKSLVDKNTKLEINTDTEKQFLKLQHIIGPHTLYSNIKEFPKASHLEIDLNSNLDSYKVKKYWKPNIRTLNPVTIDEEFDFLFLNALKKRIPEEVNWVLYKSNGVDSNLIFKELYQTHNVKTITYSKEEGTRKDFEKDFGEVVKHLDMPVGSFSSHALYKLSKRAKDLKAKVVITGEGADEVFGGYTRYLPVALLNELNTKHSNYQSLFNKAFDNYIYTYAKITAREEDVDYYANLIRPYFRNYDPITAMQMFDIDYILPSLLQMGDRMAMANGVENRCPYLDKELVSFGLSLPMEYKISDMNTKVLLRRKLGWGAGGIEKQKTGLIIDYNNWYKVGGYNRNHYFNKLYTEWKKQNSHLL